MSRRIAVALLLVAASLTSFAPHNTANGATLVGDPFSSSYTGWTDAFPPPTARWQLATESP